MLKKLLLLNTLWLAVLLGFAPAQAQKLETAIFAGGCFWCIESDFDKVKGVVETVSGYGGGTSTNPTYNTYIKGGHIEVLKITYDADKTSYKKLLEAFWYSVNPTDPGGQFCDRGRAYSTAIFAQTRTQAKIAKASKAALQKAHPDKTIHTPVNGKGRFYPSEAYHQGYAARNPIRYKFYRSSCGRDRTVKNLWGKLAYTGISGH